MSPEKSIKSGLKSGVTSWADYRWRRSGGALDRHLVGLACRCSRRTDHCERLPLRRRRSRRLCWVGRVASFPHHAAVAARGDKVAFRYQAGAGRPLGNLQRHADRGGNRGLGQVRRRCPLRGDVLPALRPAVGLRLPIR
jgi:hypothetical protein